MEKSSSSSVSPNNAGFPTDRRLPIPNANKQNQQSQHGNLSSSVSSIGRSNNNIRSVNNNLVVSAPMPTITNPVTPSSTAVIDLSLDSSRIPNSLPSNSASIEDSTTSKEKELLDEVSKKTLPRVSSLRRFGTLRSIRSIIKNDSATEEKRFDENITNSNQHHGSVNSTIQKSTPSQPSLPKPSLFRKVAKSESPDLVISAPTLISSSFQTSASKQRMEKAPVSTSAIENSHISSLTTSLSPETSLSKKIRENIIQKEQKRYSRDDLSILSLQEKGVVHSLPSKTYLNKPIPPLPTSNITPTPAYSGKHLSDGDIASESESSEVSISSLSLKNTNSTTQISRRSDEGDSIQDSSHQKSMASQSSSVLSSKHQQALPPLPQPRNRSISKVNSNPTLSETIQQQKQRLSSPTQTFQTESPTNINESTIIAEASLPSSPEISSEQREKFEKKRTFIVSELITTEESYIETLNVVMKNYYEPLEKRIASGDHKYFVESKQPMNHEHLTYIFSNISTILEFNKELLQELKLRKENWSQQAMIGDIFLRLTPFLKLYTEYSNNYDRSVDLLKRATKHCASFRDFLDERRIKSESEDLLPPLDALLITPVQRIPRYNLLLKDLIRHTSEAHPDYQNLTAALTLMEEIADHINNSMKTSDNFKRLVAIENSFTRGTSVEIVAPHRCIIKEGSLIDISNEKKKKTTFLFLFNDCVVFARPLLMNRFSFKLMTPIMQTFVFDIPESPIYTFSFKIQTPSRTFTVQTNVLADKKEWIKFINETRDKQMEIEGAKMIFKLLKKEEEKKMLEKLKSAAEKQRSQVNVSGSSSIRLNSEMERIMMESKKLEMIKEELEEKRKQEVLQQRKTEEEKQPRDEHQKQVSTEKTIPETQEKRKSKLKRDSLKD